MYSNSELVSIVLPIYNGEKFMHYSIDSVINQTYNNWELIIIDDCSTDNTAKIANEYVKKDSRIKYYKNEVNLKLPRGLNRGFTLSKGKYLTWTSDDNIYLPNALEEMVDAINSENAGFVFASCDIIDENGEITGNIKAPKNYQSAILGRNFVGACFMYTRDTYELVGEYNTERFLVEDYDYWLRIFCKCKVTYINETLYQYRTHSGALTSTEKQEKIFDVCEVVLLDNVGGYGKLNWLQKYYFYTLLNQLRQTKQDKKEKNKYKFKKKFYGYLYLLRVRIPRKLSGEK